MKRALFLFLALALVRPAHAQDSATNGSAQVISVNVSNQGGEVRIEINATAPIAVPDSVHVSVESLIIDLPGVSYPVSAHRYRVNQQGIRDIRIWLQQQQPPITRISIELAQDSRYLITQEAGGMVLRLGPSVPGQTLSAALPPGKRENPAATGRPVGPSRAIDSIAGIFNRPKPPSVDQATNPPVPPVTPAPAPPAPQIAGATPAEPPAPAIADAQGVSAELATSAPVPPTVPTAAPAAAPEPALASAPAPPATNPPATPEPPAGVLAGANAEAGSSPDTNPTTQPPSASASAEAASPRANGVFSDANELGRTALRSSATQPESFGPPVNAESAAVILPVPSGAPAGAEPLAVEPVVGGRPVNSEDVAAAAQAFVQVPNADLRTLFHVKFVQQDSAYIDGGRSSGLAEGMKLAVKDAPLEPGANTGTGSVDIPEAIQAELVVVGVAETSAVTEIRAPKRDVVPGDLAYLSAEDTQALVQQHALGTTRKYPAVISFTEGGDALDAEAHAEVPRPPMPSVNHARGRIGFDYMGLQSTDASSLSSRDIGAMLQVDFTRIGGTYWNLNGYWRGQLNSASSPGQFQTLQELINRTYHIGLTYDNPNSHWVAGIGRMYLPWASSLDTIDGGYFGRRVRPGFIVGIFAGSSPDPTSWNYNPNLQMGGTFVNLEGGNFDRFHYSSTTGAGVNLIRWQMNRPFVFFENTISYHRNFSIYHALQADSPAGNPAVSSPGAGIGSSFLTVRWSPISRLQLDGNHTYFRNVPTFDPTLVGTGLLDKYLFQGFSAGAHVDVVKQISVYTELGRSNRTADSSNALNEMYGVTFGHVPLLDLRADAHYSSFNSSFGSGTYEAITLSRSFNERIRLDLLAGNQAFISTLAGNQSARFLTTTVDSTLGSKFFVQGSFTLYRGDLQNYNQWLTTFGYRFDFARRR